MMNCCAPSKRRRTRKRVVWSKEEDSLLLDEVRAWLDAEDEDVEDSTIDDIEWDEIAENFPGKSSEQCVLRYSKINELYRDGNYFAILGDLNQREVQIDTTEWGALQAEVCRENPPDFERIWLMEDDRNHREFLHSYQGARLGDTVELESMTTVSDALIPVDIFGEQIIATDKAHLLPKSRRDAITWDYPACAVLGLSMSPVNETITRKAVLGCYNPKSNPSTRYPGIRNFLCNILRMSNQGPLFDTSPCVVILPVGGVQFAKEWTGQGYDAIVLCDSALDAKRIGMASPKLIKSKSANPSELEDALDFASKICRFLAHSVLQKSEEEVNRYQDERGVQNYAKFRSEQKIILPQLGSSDKPACKISFAGHDTRSEGGHPAPDPMLLAFKSCNNWCRKHAGFRMVAGSEPEESDDDLSEEGRQILNNYLSWEHAELKRRQHDEIMEMFGGEASIAVV